MRCHIRLLGRAGGAVDWTRVVWLAGYNPEAEGGRGHIVATMDRARAMEFESQAQAMACYLAVPVCHPVRDTDGKPNRPLTGYAIEVTDADVHPLLSAPAT